MTTEPFHQWAIVELFGHQRIAGLVTNEAIGGCAFVRVDVPEAPGRQPYTRLLGQGAIYAINIVSEDVARAAAATFRSEPVSVFDLPDLARLGHGDMQQPPAGDVIGGTTADELPF